ncbi:hypothetical protein ACFW16_26530 [Inquilinus sp. NPDC058860]|uniref:hypothetical protein n=1 Tax=Inquilinus sp. NPDC058860 TaxID=3346652 RepID=UPI00368ED64D
MIRAALLVLPALLSIAVPASAQEAEGWGTGVHMGTAYAGLTNADGAHLGVYCADDIAPQGSQAGRTGAYVLFSLPRKLALEAKSVPVTFTVDGKATAVPMAVTLEEVATSFDWGPSKAFTTDQMKALVETLRRGKTLTVGLAEPAVTEPFTLAGSGTALENIFDCAKR